MQFQVYVELLPPNKNVISRTTWVIPALSSLRLGPRPLNDLSEWPPDSWNPEMAAQSFFHQTSMSFLVLCQALQLLREGLGIRLTVNVLHQTTSSCNRNYIYMCLTFHGGCATSTSLGPVHTHDNNVLLPISFYKLPKYMYLLDWRWREDFVSHIVLWGIIT